jgi:hypothetical protein
VLVQLIGADSTVLVSSFSDDAGQFTLSVDGCGPPDSFLYVARIGYQTIRVPVQDLPEDCSAWTITLEADPVGLREVAVRAFRNRDLENAGFYRRQRWGIGTFITRELLEDRYRTLNRLSDVIQQVPGVVRVVQTNDASRIFFHRSIATTLEPCPAVAYVDGLYFGPDLPRLTVHDVEAIELYRGPAQVPAQYSGTSALCGAVLIWTRTGAGR